MRTSELSDVCGRLKADGYRLEITYMRRVEQLHHDGRVTPLNGYYKADTIKNWGPGYRVGPCGGRVEIDLVRDGRIIVSGRADCSDLDNFNGKLGQAIALGRCLKELQAR